MEGNEERLNTDESVTGLTETYLSCEFLEGGLALNSAGMNHCCGNVSEDYNPQCAFTYAELFDSDVDDFINRIIEDKKALIEKNRAGKRTMCSGCEFLKEGEWEKEKRINSLNISFDNSCNFRCVYCYKTKADKNKTPMDFKEEDILKRLLSAKKVQPDKQVVYSSGEISVQPNAENILDILKNYNLSIFTNASKYSEKIHELIKRDGSSMVISVDSGTRETFKQVKGADMFERVWENIGKYACDNDNVILKYILMSSNCDSDNLNGFIEKCVKNNIKHIRVSRNWHYDGNKIEEGVFKGSVLLMRKAQKAGITVHNDGITQV